MTLEKFNKLDAFSHFKQQKLVSIENKSELMSFYSLKYNEQSPVFFMCWPDYASLISDTSHRYIVIEIDNDSVLVVFGIVQIKAIKQIRIIDTPISKLNNSENVSIILKHLLSLPFVKIVFRQSDLLPEFNNYDRLETYDDYYYDYASHNYNSTFRSKFGINKLLKDEKFSYKFINGTDFPIQDLQIIRNLWKEDMILSGHDISTKSDRDFIKIITSKYSKLWVSLLYYDDKIVSAQIFLFTDLNYANCLYTLGIGRRFSEHAGNLRLLLSNISRIQNYFGKMLLNSKNISYNYIAGCRRNEKGLLRHKQQITDGHIVFYIETGSYTSDYKESSKLPKLF